MRLLGIVLQRTESQQTGGESQCECTRNRWECTTMRYEPTGTDANWYDVGRCNTTQYEKGFDSQGQYKCFEYFKTFVLACELMRKWQQTNTKQFESIWCCAMRNECQFILVCRQNSQQWDGGSIKPLLTYHHWGLVAFNLGNFHRKYSVYISMNKIYLKIAHLTWQPYLLGGPLNWDITVCWVQLIDIY